MYLAGFRNLFIPAYPPDPPFVPNMFPTLHPEFPKYLQIIEVAEDIAIVVKRFYNSGMIEAQVAECMDIPIDYVKACLKP